MLLEPPFCDLAGLQGMGDSPDESMSIPSASASLAVVVGGRLASRKSEEEGRRAGSPRGKECDRFDRQLATKAKWGRQRERFDLQAGSRSVDKSVEGDAQSIAVLVAGDCEAAV